MKNKLKEHRKTRGWSQADLARALKISRQAVNGFESGKFTPSLEMAFKIALLFDTAIESVFVYQEKNPMQNLLEKVKDFTQWLPRGERFTEKAIAVIEYAQRKAALSQQAEIEPEHLLRGLLNYPTTIAGHLLKESGLVLEMEAIEEVPKINKFSSESKYVLELALNAARLHQKKYIDTEHILLGLIQLTQLGNEELVNIFQSYEVDVATLVEKIVLSK